MDAPDLTTLDDTQYETVALAQIHPRHRDPAVWDLLTSPEHIARTRTLLGQVHARTANALRRRKAEREEFHQECLKRGQAGKQEWFETGPEYEKWRRGAASFHQTVQAAISEIGKKQRTQNRDSNHLSRAEERETLRKLAVAVSRHQAEHARSGEIAGQEDYELWQLLDQLTVPCGPDHTPTTLRTMLDFYWTDVAVVTDVDKAQGAAERSMRQAPAGRSGQYTGTPRARHVGNEKPLAG